MPSFDKNKIKELRDFLYNSYVHDAELGSVKYNYREDTLKFECFNPIFKVKIDLTFRHIEIVLVMKGKFYGNRETILSLTAEDDFSYLQNHLLNHGEGMEDSLYLLFQMFSGDEWHIVSKEVSIEISR